MAFPSQSVIDLFKETKGACSVCELCAISSIAEQVRVEGNVVEFGSHAGKASLAIAEGLSRSGVPRTFHLIDPVYDLDNEKAWSQTLQKSSANMPWGHCREPNLISTVYNKLCSVAPNLSFNFHGTTSLDAMESIGGPISFAYIDSDAHEMELMRKEMDALMPKLPVGSIVAFHDFGNYADVERIYRELCNYDLFKEIPIDWDSIRNFVGGREAGNETWHCCHEPHPCHVAALRKNK